MARTSKGSKRKQVQAEKAKAQPKASVSRRAILGWVGAVAIGVGALGMGGVWAVNSFNQSLDTHDLSRIGQGQPTVVQVHDPQCPICNALQKETYAALDRLDGEVPLYLIADISQTEGAIFAQSQRVPHVTLLLFDAKGNRVETLSGSRTRDELEPIFAKHAVRGR